MPEEPKTNYIDGQTVKKHRWRKRVALAISILMLLVGVYILVLVFIPKAKELPGSTIDYKTSDDDKDMRNRVQIERINLEVPFFGDNTPASLEKGAWWRFPERGNPEKGGNFILSAHRFNLGVTPQGTRAKSPFYNLNEIQPGDKIKVFYNKKWYEYEVTKNYTVDRTAVEIEKQSTEPKMTLYTCSLKGEADGRVVIDAKPLFDTKIPKPPEDGSPLL